MNQSVFRKKDGTALHLARIIHSLSEALEKKNAVVSCFFDLTKAFDRVWHKGLLAKLEHLGIGGSLLRWLTNYLENRTQRVRIGKVVSSWQGNKGRCSSRLCPWPTFIYNIYPRFAAAHFPTSRL